ncbi:MAG: heat-inducible transcriptional repressor HrcA [candidate division Zixibacteria bacterium]|nr:heat-inducible transcriptional repressor HrcA [candidate division Zixibacteria bacterium]
MAFENLSEREKRVLSNLINYYIASAGPVGSRVIANKFKMGISSATIRNTLQDLEELGLVLQPHTSAGRVPTDLGYRVYVDFLLQPNEPTKAEKEYIKDTLLKEGREINAILGQTCRILSEITSQLGVSIAPRFDEGVLKHIDLIPISEERIMAVVVVRSGLARSVIIEVEASIPETSLREVESLLNERLGGLTLGEIRDTIYSRLADTSIGGRLIKLIIDSKDRIWTEKNKGDVHISGADNLLLQPEFADLDQVSQLIKLVEDGSVLRDFLLKANKEGLFITIGQENKFSKILNCSLVTSSYRVGEIIGTIGVVGPTRMPYNKLSSLVDYTARTITQVLKKIDEREES